jgi:hypothetical protein
MNVRVNIGAEPTRCVGLGGSDFEHLNIETVARKVQEFLEPTNHSKFASNVTI